MRWTWPAVLMFCRVCGARRSGLTWFAPWSRFSLLTSRRSSSSSIAVQLMKAIPVSLPSRCAGLGIGGGALSSLGTFDWPQSYYCMCTWLLAGVPGFVPVLGVLLPSGTARLWSMAFLAYGISSRVHSVSTMRRPVVWGSGVMWVGVSYWRQSLPLSPGCCPAEFSQYNLDFACRFSAASRVS